MAEFSVGQQVRIRMDAVGDGFGVRGRRGTIEGLTELPSTESAVDEALQPGYLVHLAGEAAFHDRWLALPSEALEGE